MAVPHVSLLELDAPRMTTGCGARHVVAQWATTGAPLAKPAPRPAGRFSRLRRPKRGSAPRTAEVERPLWRTVLILYASITVVVVISVALVFLISLLVEGSAY